MSTPTTSLPTEPTAPAGVAVAKGLTAPAPTIVHAGPQVSSTPLSRAEVVAHVVGAPVPAVVPMAGAKNTMVWVGTDTDLHVEFVQRLPDGSVDASSTFCLNSTAATLDVAEELVGIRIGPSWLTVRTGGQVIMARRTARATYELAIPVDGGAVAIADVAVRGQRVTVLRAPLPYVWLAVDDLGAAEALEPLLEAVRSLAALIAGLPVSPSLPKVGLLVRTEQPEVLGIRTRMSPGAWHPGLPVSGVVSLAVAAASGALPGGAPPGEDASTSTPRVTAIASDGTALTATTHPHDGGIAVVLTVEVTR